MLRVTSCMSMHYSLELEIGDYQEYGHLLFSKQYGSYSYCNCLHHTWYFFCSILTPLQAVCILIWYIVREIIENEEEKWYRYSRASLIMVLTQVVIYF